MELTIPINQYYQDLETLAMHHAPTYVIRDALLYNILIRKYLIAGIKNNRDRAAVVKDVYSGESGPTTEIVHFLEWKDGWVHGSMEEIVGEVKKAWGGINDEQVKIVTRFLWRGDTGGMGTCYYPVPSYDIAIRCSRELGFPWEHRRLPFRKHKLGNKWKHEPFSMLIFHPPGSRSNLEIYSGVLNGEACLSGFYVPIIAPEQLETTINAFCELFGMSWAYDGKVVEIVTLATNEPK